MDSTVGPAARDNSATGEENKNKKKKRKSLCDDGVN